jgi:tryptophan 2,3-dioxygenase
MTSGAEQILNGLGENDYQRYIRTQELLALQPEPASWVHRDELLFTVVHQTSELWLKLAASEVTYTLALLDENRIRPALRHLNRVQMCVRSCIEALDMLEQMSPWDYQQVRKALGHGSGFDSPGFNLIRTMMPVLGSRLEGLLATAGLTLETLFVDHLDHDDLFDLAESLMTLDEMFIEWRDRHFRVVERTIGLHVKGTQGTPVEVIGGLRDRQFFPAMWNVRSALSNLADERL